MLASRLGVPYIDTGAMYRAVGVAARERGYRTPDHRRRQRRASGGVARDRARDLRGAGAGASQRPRRHRRDPGAGDLAVCLGGFRDSRGPPAPRDPAATPRGRARRRHGGAGHRNQGLPRHPAQVLPDGSPEVRARPARRRARRPGHSRSPTRRSWPRWNGATRDDQTRKDSPLTHDETYVVVDSTGPDGRGRCRADRAPRARPG